MVVALLNGGPLLKQWVPPSQCLSTASALPSAYTTRYMQGFWRGSVDTECFPSISVSTPDLVTKLTVATVTSTSGDAIVIHPTTVPTVDTFWLNPSTIRDVTSTALYYSPGVCPSGYTYAATFTDSVVVRAPLATNTVPDTPGVPDNRFLCCPDGFKPVMSSSTLENKSTRYGYGYLDSTTKTVTDTIVQRYSYPFCTSGGTGIKSVVDMSAGWSAPKPTGPVYSVANYATVTAIGMVVGWRESDATITQYLRDNSISLPTAFTAVSTRTSSPSSVYNTSDGPSSSMIALAASLSSIGFICFLTFCCLGIKRHRRARLRIEPKAPSRLIVEQPQSDYARNGETDIELANVGGAPSRAHLDPTNTDELLQPPPPTYQEATTNHKP